MKPIRHPISTDAASALLARVVPGSRLVAMTEGEGSFSNTTYLLDGQRSDGSEFQVVARRYATFGNYDRSEKARREYRTLELLSAHGVPVPQPLYLDDEGEYFGSPGIVTRYVEGALVQNPTDAHHWARRLARVLADIHMVPYEPVNGLLLDANAEVLWFLKGGTMPDYMAAHPLGPAVWEASRRLASKLRPAPALLVHVDFWTGNVLWQGETVSAVLDWEEAARGDAAVDVAYCRMDLTLLGYPDAAAVFLDAYETATSKPTANLALWQLAAAVRPMFNPDGWGILAATQKERFAAFVEDALERASLA